MTAPTFRTDKKTQTFRGGMQHSENKGEVTVNFTGEGGSASMDQQIDIECASR